MSSGKSGAPNIERPLSTSDDVQPLKVGRLSQITGLSIRALHHYDEIGLLKPSLRTEAGHRLYARSDLERLQQIQSLKSMGISLDDIRTFVA